MSQFRTSGDRFERSGLTLSFWGFEKLVERDSFRQILFYTKSNFLQGAARKKSLPEQDTYGMKEKSRRSECGEFRLPGTASRVTAWPLDFKGLKTSGKRSPSWQALNCYLCKPRMKNYLSAREISCRTKIREIPTENRSGFAYRVPFCM